ncbi:hypothetical protein C0993_007852 [Termitomyces sp. T159_Od127]|nr:hypothetical protein C0993_007852 [Termitomyces sp. T159_Od127]
MRLSAFLATVAVLVLSALAGKCLRSGLVHPVTVAAEDAIEPAVVVTANFLDANPFGRFLMPPIRVGVPMLTYPSSITTYLMVAAIIGGLVYLVYMNFVPQPKKPRFKKASPSSVPSASSSAATTGSGSYQEEWIPEHHLKKIKKSSGVALSGDELSGSELSGTEGRKRKGKK